MNSIKTWSIPETTKHELACFIDDLELGKVNRGRRISESRRLKYLDLLKVPLEFWNTPTEDLSLTDVESFERALNSGQIVSKLKNEPYMAATRADIKKVLKIFLRWRLGREKAAALTEWLDTRTPRKTPDYLSEAEVEKLLKRCRTVEQRYTIAVLFDAGARAEEFHNIRLEDIRLPEGKDNYVRITFKEEYSKTKGRVVALYWKHSVDAVRDYIRERIEEGVRPKEQIYLKAYDTSRRWLFRFGQEVLGRPIHYHLFRHSSATFYANKLNRQELCYRYGWAFSSDMPDVYIARSGMVSKELDERFANSEIGELRMALERVEGENKVLRESIERTSEKASRLAEDFSEFKEVLYRIKSLAANQVQDKPKDFPPPC